MADSTAQAGTAQETTETTQVKAEKTFTQAELDSIVKSRLYEEKQKFGNYDELKKKAERLDQLEEASKTELQKAQDRAAKAEDELAKFKKAEEIREAKAKVAAKTGVPSELLTGEDEEACEAQAKAILEFAKTKGYPVVKDGGEPGKVGKPSTKEQFAEWAKQIL